MATLWLKLDNESYESHDVRSLGLPPDDARARDDDQGNGHAISGLRIVEFDDRSRQRFALIADRSSHVLVNGQHAIGGLHVLRHKDELLLKQQLAYFSSESSPTIEPFEAADGSRRVRCPVCRGAIEDQQHVVRCPGCSRVYHQIDGDDDSPGKPCWTYATRCRFCEHPTSLSGEGGWHPMDLEATSSPESEREDSRDDANSTA